MHTHTAHLHGMRSAICSTTCISKRQGLSIRLTSLCEIQTSPVEDLTLKDSTGSMNLK